MLRHLSQLYMCWELASASNVLVSAPTSYSTKHPGTCPASKTGLRQCMSSCLLTGQCSKARPITMSACWYLRLV